MRIACGWCGNGTEARPCSSCGRDPELAYRQRDQVPPAFDDRTKRLAEARKTLRDQGRAITVAVLADELGVDERTVRRWQGMSGR